MPIYLLGSRTPSVEIPNQAMSISISGSVDGVALYVDAGAAQQEFIRVNPHVMIIPALDHSGLTVGVEPVGATTFRDDTIVHLAMGPDSPGQVDPDQVGFDPVDVSGAHGMELAALTPHGASVRVTAQVGDEVPLSPLACMARTAARRRAGKERRRRGGSLTIGVDASASMKAAFEDGSVSAAIDILAGVSDVAGVKDAGAALVGARCTLIDAPIAELAQAVTGTPMQWSAGARWSQLPDSERTIVVTDALNYSLHERFPTIHISRDERVRASGALLAPPPPGTRAEAHLGAHPAVVDQIAAALLSMLT